MAEESGFRKIFWMAFGALVTGVAGIPIGYYVLDPLMPKAKVVPTIQRMSRVNGQLMIFFDIENQSNRLPAKSVTMRLTFERPLTFYPGDAPISFPHADPLCRKLAEDGDDDTFSVSFSCDLINAQEKREFVVLSQHNDYKQITMYVGYEGYSITTTYTFCSWKGDTYYYANVRRCPDRPVLPEMPEGLLPPSAK
jgi:hypothetical protein